MLQGPLPPPSRGRAARSVVNQSQRELPGQAASPGASAGPSLPLRRWASLARGWQGLQGLGKEGPGLDPAERAS